MFAAFEVGLKLFGVVITSVLPRQGCKMSCALQGVPEERLRVEIATALQRTALPLEMAERPAGQYSGGSKRKLALGIALVGGSRTILLDEPSSGMVGCPLRRHTVAV